MTVEGDRLEAISAALCVIARRAAPKQSSAEPAVDAALDCFASLAMTSLATSALVRPAHQLQRVFDVPPVPGLFDLALRFEVDGLAGGFDDGLRALGFQELSCAGVDLDFSHGGVLLPPG
jgi:hypothetical protein